MIENINNILEKINNIREIPKNIQNLKPEFVQEFENMYKEINSTKTNSNTNNIVKNNIHPYLEKSVEKKENEIKIENINDKEGYKSKTVKINDSIIKASKKYKISEDLIRAIIRVESSYNPTAISNAGAMGLMQLMPHTVLNSGIDKPFDIYENIDAGTRYIKNMLDRYDGDLEKALAAYNAGPHRVDEADGIPDIEETINYVDKIKKILFK